MTESYGRRPDDQAAMVQAEGRPTEQRRRQHGGTEDTLRLPAGGAGAGGKSNGNGKGNDNGNDKGRDGDDHSEAPLPHSLCWP